MEVSSRRRSGTARLIRLLAVAVLLPIAPAQAGGLQIEAWRGDYVCGQGITALTLTMEVDPAGKVQALFEFQADSRNPGVPRGCFEMSGRLDSAGHVILRPGRWRLQPPGYVTVSLIGEISADRSFAGQVDGPGCGAFVLDRLPDPGDDLTACGGAES